MFDENEHTHPQNNDEGPRHIHRGIKRSVGKGNRLF